MLSTKFMLAVSSVLAYANAASNVAVYWGQNAAGDVATPQQPLSTYCQDASVDTVILSFVNAFPTLQVNFANQCGLTFDNGLLHCPTIGEDIAYCQAQGKKVLLSLGGQLGDYGFTSDAEATEFATTLWNKFGGGEDPERPFDTAVVDGFDLDIEHGSTVGYPALVTALKAKYATDASKSYYVSASPQCVFPDASLGETLSSVALDFIFIQFYNNPCSLDQTFNWKTWADFAKTAPNPNVQLYVGLPASTGVAGYVDVATVASKLSEFQCSPNFGGISVWDASTAWLNVQAGVNYVDGVKAALQQNAGSCSPASSSSSVAPSSSAAPVDPTSSAPAPSSFSGYSNATTVTNIATTVVTITSCSDNACTKVPVTTGLTTVTEHDTVYTTYCPLTDVTPAAPTTAAPSAAPSSAAPVAPSAAPVAPSVAPVAPSVAPSVAPASSVASTSTKVNTVYVSAETAAPVVSYSEGAASSNQVGFAFAALAAAALMI